MMEFAQPYDNVPDDDWEQHGTMVSAIAAQVRGARLNGGAFLEGARADCVAPPPWAGGAPATRRRCPRTAAPPGAPLG